jgi:hypothetical protein
LKETGGFRIEDAARDIEVGDGIAIKQHVGTLKTEQERNYRGTGGQPEEKSDLGIPGGTFGEGPGRPRYLEFGYRVFHGIGQGRGLSQQRKIS